MKFAKCRNESKLKKGLAAECGLDGETAAKIGEQKSDSRNLAEMMMSLEEAQPSTDYQPKRRPKLTLRYGVHRMGRLPGAVKNDDFGAGTMSACVKTE
ncbi:MAG TPA: hypothetical protein VN749_08855 [Candidatus Eisenbacteria bacterium]|jgi:hypothetical protein|nr:hypothetical protein [Candidatus Eisenbacteria bacterium]